MIISNSRDFIFIHIPKCGGSSILSHLDRTILPQIDWVQGKTAKAHVYRLENLAAAIADLTERLFGDAPLPLEVPRHNASTEPGEWMRMSERAEAMVRELYREDFDHFGYADRIERP